MIPSTQALLAAASSAVSAAAVRLLDLSQAVNDGKPARDVARQCEYTIRLATIALRDIAPTVRALAKVRR